MRVAIRRKRERWQGLPSRIKHALTKGVARVSDIRLAILSCSTVRELPPVEIIDVGWVTPKRDAAIHGRSHPLAIGREFEYGASLAAPTVIYASDVELRGVLLHEFAHCFHHIRTVWRALARGDTRVLLGSDPSRLLDPEYDRAALDPPDLWFCKQDVDIFPYQHSGMLTSCTNAIFTEWVAKGLPTETPHPHYKIPTISVPEAIAERVEQTELGQ